MSTPVPVRLASTQLAGHAGLPLLMLGPSLGTSAIEVWSPVARLLGETYRVVAWDLPGHGASPSLKRPFTVADIARAVAALIPRYRADSTYIAGVSLGGAVALTVQLDSPGLAVAAAIICSGARIGSPNAWEERAAQVRSSGTGSLMASAAARWFSPTTVERSPSMVDSVTRSLRDVDDASYARCCEALAEYHVTDRLSEIDGPLLALWAEHDAVTPEGSAIEVARGVRNGTIDSVADASHLAPIEQPSQVAGLLGRFFGT
jgi:3-oxoadipate enol-lactonase